MFSRISQLARHLSRPLPNYAHRSAAAISSNMTSSLPVRSKQQSMIHTAACLIIGDEVLGGKVWHPPATPHSFHQALTVCPSDGRHQLSLHGQVLLLVRHADEACRSHSRRRRRDNRSHHTNVQELRFRGHEWWHWSYVNHFTSTCSVQH